MGPPSSGSHLIAHCLFLGHEDVFLTQCLLEPLGTQDPVTRLEGSWAERRGNVAQVAGKHDMARPHPSPRVCARGSGSRPGPILGRRSLCSVASVSSSLLRMMVWVGGRAGARAGGGAVFLPSGLWSRWMWNLRCPLRLKLRGEDAGSAAAPRPPPPGPAAPEGLAQPHRCPQSWHSKGFSLVWVSMCRRRSFLFLEAKLHWLHWWGRRLACWAMWACGQGGGSAAQGRRLPAHQPGATVSCRSAGAGGGPRWLHREAAQRAQPLLTLRSPL